jgi:Flp pilus assembly protein TadD
MSRRKQNRFSQRNKASSAAASPPEAVASGVEAPRLASGALSPINDDGPRAWVAASFLAVAIGAVYGPALDVPLIFDDNSSILTNTSITTLWPPVGNERQRGPLNPEPQLPTAGRPLVNLSFAVNYYFGRYSSYDYHAVNAAIHFLSALLLWAITRRTLRMPVFGGRFEGASSWLAIAVAMLWALHPLPTEAVIYATQRTELMFALFYLATLYCSMRYWQQDAATGGLQRAIWLLLAVGACSCGMASKEVMVSAPLMVLLYERTFIAGSLAAALRRSWALYVGLALTWLLLLALNLSGPRSDTAGFDLDVSAYSWWLTQAKALVMYWKLVVWPDPLLIHHEFPYLETLAEGWVYVIPVLVIGLGTLWLLWRNHPVGYLGTWMFAILSPTLVIPIVTEMAAERRMYLPLAAIAALFVVGSYRLCQFASTNLAGGRQTRAGFRRWRIAFLLAAIVLIFGYGVASAKRLDVYNNVEQLWQDVLKHYPRDHMALYNRGHWLAKIGRLNEAVESFEYGLTVKPDDIDTLNNLGVTLMRLGRYSEAMQHLRHAIRVEPTAADLHSNLGIVLLRDGKLPEAMDELQTALKLDAENIDALNHLGVALLLSGRHEEAIRVLQRAVELVPDNSELRNHLGSALARSGNAAHAIEQYRRALELNPDDLEAHYNLGLLLPDAGLVDDAISHLEQTVRLHPGQAEFHGSLADLLRKNGRAQDAINHYREAVRLQPDFVDAYVGLTQALSQSNRSAEAIAEAGKAIEVARAANRPDAAEQMDTWLNHYRNEMRRASETPSNSESAPEPQ